jgi:hypothetical protein
MPPTSSVEDTPSLDPQDGNESSEKARCIAYNEDGQDLYLLGPFLTGASRQQAGKKHKEDQKVARKMRLVDERADERLG